jgi:acetyl-CoA decarbonylase/synthase complex subunit gamma
LDGIDGWLVVLDTDGINVWCAAGKGTFGTDELVRRVESARLAEIVSHKKLIVPQLGAPGVSAHEVKRRCGFSVIFGPIRAEDISIFLKAGMKATPVMRRVKFPLRDRIALIPVEIVTWSHYVVITLIAVTLLSALASGSLSLRVFLSPDLYTSALVVLGAFLSSAILTPTLLPWLPGRAFSIKGAWIGLAFMVAVNLCIPTLFGSWFSRIGWLLISTAIGSFVAMNFTGASTYTSLSGVLREMRFAVPAQIAVAAGGITIWLIGKFL